jgi:hypothetical protein
VPARKATPYTEGRRGKRSARSGSNGLAGGPLIAHPSSACLARKQVDQVDERKMKRALDLLLCVPALNLPACSQDVEQQDVAEQEGAVQDAGAAEQVGRPLSRIAGNVSSGSRGDAPDLRAKAGLSSRADIGLKTLRAASGRRRGSPAYHGTAPASLVRHPDNSTELPWHMCVTRATPVFVRS